MNIGKKIKALRKQRDITQERLAEYLNVTAQAVSKWENGIAFPDITLIAPIASFFGITTDELLSHSISERNERLEEYRKQIRERRFNFDIEGTAELCRKALKEFPGEYEFMLRLAKNIPGSNAEEIVSLCERVYEDCDDEYLREDAKAGLCRFLPLVGRRDEALELANTLTDFYFSKQLTLAYILNYGDTKNESVIQAQSNIEMLAMELACGLLELSSNQYMGETLSIDEKIKFAEAALQVYSAVFYEGHMAKNGGGFRHIYQRLAELYCLKDSKKALEFLRLAAEAAIEYDKQTGSDENYTALFLRDCRCRQFEYSHAVRLLQIMGTRKAYDELRPCAGYAEIQDMLQRAAGVREN